MYRNFPIRLQGQSENNDSRRLGGDPGRPPRGSCLAISAHLSDRRAGPHHHVEVARRWPLAQLTQIEEEILKEIFLLNTGKPGPQRKTDLVSIHSPLELPQTSP